MSGHYKWSEIKRKRGGNMSEAPAGAKFQKIEPPKTVEEANWQLVLLVLQFVELENKREALRAEVDAVSKKMGDTRYMIGATKRAKENLRG